MTGYDINSVSSMEAYLLSKNILFVQSAARMAGLRFKNGDAGTKKAELIARLCNTPSMLRAACASVARMESGAGPLPVASAVDSLLDDIKAEAGGDSPAPVASPSPAPIAAPSVDSAQVTALSRRVETLEGYAISRATAATIAAQEVAPLAKRVNADIDSLSARLAILEERRPIEIKMPDAPPITIASGEHKSFPKLLQYLKINRRVILTGSAGTGKSMAVKKAAELFGLGFYLQTPVTMAHEYLGHKDAQGVFHETPTFQAYTKGGLLLWDEADAGLPDAMLAANPIFDGNGFATFGDGKMYAQHPDFMAVFNMNTDGNGATMQYAGRNRLDGATLARFGVRIHWAIDSTIEASMAGAFADWHACCVAVRRLMESRGIVDVNATPRHVKTGAALLGQTAGISREDILTDVLKSGALSEVWSDVLRLPEVVRFLKG